MENNYTVPIKGINQDIFDGNVDGTTYSYALNATVEHFTEQQSFPFLGNSPSNVKCFELQENELVIGTINIVELNKTILAINNENENYQKFVEINYLGLIEHESSCGEVELIANCTNKELIKTNCFKWSNNNPLKIVYKLTDCTLNLYWVNNLDEDRFIYFDLIDKELYLNDNFKINEGNLCTPDYTYLDCDKTKWYPQIEFPCIELELIDSGNKSKGTYSYMVAFCSYNGIPLTGFNSLTNPFPLQKNNKAIKVNLNGFTKDSRYKYLLLVCAETINGITTYHQKTVLGVEQNSWVDYNNGGYNISIKEIFSKYPFYKNSNDITIANNILFKSGVSEFEKFNLQPIVNLIELEAVTIKLKLGDYKNPQIAQDFRSFLRDEVYALSLQFELDNGELIPAFPLIGRKKNEIDKILIDSQNLCDITQVENWKKVNSCELISQNNYEYDECTIGKEIFQVFDFGYYESTELYPYSNVFDSTKVGGENLCGTPIRHFKMPDHSCSLHTDGTYIFPLGVRIKSNISELLDLAVENGFITQEQRNRIIGYKILRSNRSLQKSIVARGLIYNVNQYKQLPIDDSNFSNKCDVVLKDIYYPNYPYNDLNKDKFLSYNKSHYNGYNNSVLNSSLVSFDDVFDDFDYFKRYTFHSPDTHFLQPTLGNQLQIEAEMWGKAVGFFNQSEEHALYKLMGEKHYQVARIFGIWMASTISNPSDDAISGVSANIGKGLGTTLFGSFGLGNVGGALGNLIGGLIGSKISQNTLSSQIYKNSIILSQTEKILDLFRSFSKWNQHQYQHQSVGNYNNIEKWEGEKYFNLPVKEYITEGNLTIQEENSSIHFNNSFRESSVFLKTDKKLERPNHIDNSRVLISEVSNGAYSENLTIQLNTKLALSYNIKATTGVFTIVGINCSTNLEENIQEFNFPEGGGDLDFTTDCKYKYVYLTGINNLDGTNYSLIEGDSVITQVSECNTCGDNIETTINYPCKCNSQTERDIASLYVTIKNFIPNQYGSIYDIQWISTTNCSIKIPNSFGYKKSNAIKYSCENIYTNVVFIDQCSQDVYNDINFIKSCNQDVYNNINFIDQCNTTLFLTGCAI